ncbi:MAG: sulfotransferase [Deltaproteobacteria bacterium]|nr:MAG: sulfotransferase [Deltaproteobacteria bacterium]
MPALDFVLVGAPKCGTTAMYRWLAGHPGIFLPAKELHQWGGDLHHRRPPRSREEYEALWAAARPDQLLGEVAVWYLMSTAAPDELHAMAPEARIIAMLREPVAMLHSLHSQLVYSGEEDITDFEAALAAEADRRQGRRIPSSTHAGLEAPPDECLHYRRVVDYAPQVRRWRARFGADRVLVLLHDDLKADAAGTFRQVLEFIGADPDWSPDFDVVNPNKTARSRRAQRLVQALRWGPWNRLVPPGRVRTGLRRGFELLQALNTRYAPRSPLDPQLAARLRAELRPGIEDLEVELGRDLSHWKA